MKINDHYLKEHLTHVYWLTGGACAGKTTMTNKFINDLGFQTLKDDILKYRPFTHPLEYPALQMPNPNLNYQEWFNRETEIHTKWLHDLAEELMDFFIIDLLKLSTDRPVIIDLGIMPEVILPYITKENILCLYTSQTEIERLYFFRSDHKMILDCINKNTIEPEKTIHHANKAMVKFSEDIKNACISKGIKTLERTQQLAPEDQFKMVCDYFKLSVL